MSNIVTAEAQDIKNKIVVDDVSVVYTQEADCNTSDDEIQSLRLQTENNGTARYIVFGTDRWAISDIDELIDVLRDFKFRAGIYNEPKVSEEVLTPMGHTRIWIEDRPYGEYSELEKLIRNIGWVVGYDKDFKTRYHYSIEECKDMLRRAGLKEF